MKRNYFNADDAMRDYLTAIDLASAPRGVDPEGMRGRVYVDACLSCGGQRWATKGSGVQVCVGVKRNGRRCDRPRDWEPAAVPAGFFDLNPRHGSRTDALDHLATVGLIVHRAGLWPSRMLALLCIHGVYLRVIADGRHRWPRREAGWSEYRVRQDVRTARRRIESGLSAAGLLRESLAS